MKKIAIITLGLILGLGSFVYASDTITAAPAKKHAHVKSHKQGKKKVVKHKSHKSVAKNSDKSIKSSF